MVGHESSLAEARGRLPNEISGGMQKRVALARAIAADPEILILDDPVAGLDPILTASIDGFIVESGAPREVLANPQHERTKSFLSKVL